MTKYFLLLLCLATSLLASAQNEPYKNTNLPFEERAHDLVSRMTLEEKVSQMGHTRAGDSAARHPRVRLVERRPARRARAGIRHSLSASHRHGCHVGRDR